MNSIPPTSRPAEVDVRAKSFARRLFLLKLLFAIGFVVIAGKLAQVQIIDAPMYQAMARKQHEEKLELPALRGRILDCNGNVLVSNTNFISVAADPLLVGAQAGRLAQACAEAFGRPASYYRAKLQNSAPRFAWLERRQMPETVAKLRRSGIKGIVEIPEPKRLYHYGSLAGPLLGLTDIDNKGIAGLELQYNDHLRGIPGSIIMQKDARSNMWPSADYPRIEPVNGDDLILTIDLAYQAVLEDELAKAVESNGAEGGLAILVEPHTGKILALASSPGINPNIVGSSQLEWARTRIVTDMFEPGSLFKIVTASAAFEHELISPNRIFDAEAGKYVVRQNGRLLQTVTDDHPHDRLTFQEGIEQSSNIVMAKAAELIGPERMYRQARDFGFGIPTGIELPGEIRGRLKKPQQWSGTSLRTMAYGYEVAATPLQIVMAYASIANKGILMAPRIVREVRSSENVLLGRTEPERIRRVVSERTASILTDAFKGVVVRGTAQEALSPGISIAGKTGTAKRYVNGRYQTGDYVASFAAWFPADDPQVVGLVMIENPRHRSYYGGFVAAPVLRAVAERILQVSPHIGAPPVNVASTVENEHVIVPDIRMVQAPIATKILKERGLDFELFGSGDIVLRQAPKPGSTLARGDVVRLSVEPSEGAHAQGLLVMPDLRGMSVRRAVNCLVLQDLTVDINGSGTVVSQNPPAGQRIRTGSRVAITCEPMAIGTAVLY
jgi:cell division protein FtsI (penicillin-binding protein 3)